MIDEVLPDALDGERLDRVVAMLGGCSRSAAGSLIADAGVMVDGAAPTQASVRVRAGSTVSFEPPIPKDTTAVGDPGVDVAVVYDDDHVVVVDKPSGLVVHPGAGRPIGTLVNGLLARYPDLASVGDPARPGIVHRLDAETSGLLVVARTQTAYDALVADLAARRVERIYTALVEGSVSDDRGIVDAPIGRSSQRRTRMTISEDGKPARTHYEVDARRDDPPTASLLTCRLETGRTHQIRVHLAAIGHGVVGDRTYGGGRGPIEFERVALHARQLSFRHPSSSETVSFEAPAPADLAALIRRLGFPAGG